MDWCYTSSSTRLLRSLASRTWILDVASASLALRMTFTADTCLGARGRQLGPNDSPGLVEVIAHEDSLSAARPRFTNVQVTSTVARNILEWD